ncbi:hypothetical protein F3Y22_tig00110597pilonHSYRG00362 [Hibiscus syriacus]|uniref:THH1/TOM1/TOM3 domain-containing protein n=1 Tax=Hibiscus syriacus TaxID=106335 RepID=A0A6A3A3B6_HIBSY|nr:hypothetical protein F3Y22_tig00110597pilonHSYRG00362 [Hibiscus syriacus]
MLKHVVGMLGWWDEIDKSEEWQRSIFFLSASYALISFVALVQLCRIHCECRSTGGPHKGFPLDELVVNGLFPLFEVDAPVVNEHLDSMAMLSLGIITTAPYDALEMVLLDLPNLLFFQHICACSFLGRDILQARSLPINKLRPAYYSTTDLYTCSGVHMDFHRLSKSSIAIEFARVFIQFFALAASGFILYGGRLNTCQLLYFISFDVFLNPISMAGWLRNGDMRAFRAKMPNGSGLGLDEDAISMFYTIPPKSHITWYIVGRDYPSAWCCLYFGNCLRSEFQISTIPSNEELNAVVARN